MITLVKCQNQILKYYTYTWKFYGLNTLLVGFKVLIKSLTAHYRFTEMQFYEREKTRNIPLTNNEQKLLLSDRVGPFGLANIAAFSFLFFPFSFLVSQ